MSRIPTPTNDLTRPGREFQTNGQQIRPQEFASDRSNIFGELTQVLATGVRATVELSRLKQRRASEDADALKDRQRAYAANLQPSLIAANEKFELTGDPTELITLTEAYATDTNLSKEQQNALLAGASQARVAQNNQIEAQEKNAVGALIDRAGFHTAEVLAQLDPQDLLAMTVEEAQELYDTTFNDEAEKLNPFLYDIATQSPDFLVNQDRERSQFITSLLKAKVNLLEAENTQRQTTAINQLVEAEGSRSIEYLTEQLVAIKPDITDQEAQSLITQSKLNHLAVEFQVAVESNSFDSFEKQASDLQTYVNSVGLTSLSMAVAKQIAQYDAILSKTSDTEEAINQLANQTSFNTPSEFVTMVTASDPNSIIRDGDLSLEKRSELLQSMGIKVSEEMISIISAAPSDRQALRDKFGITSEQENLVVQNMARVHTMRILDKNVTIDYSDLFSDNFDTLLSRANDYDLAEVFGTLKTIQDDTQVSQIINGMDTGPAKTALLNTWRDSEGLDILNPDQQKDSFASLYRNNLESAQRATKAFPVSSDAVSSVRNNRQKYIESQNKSFNGFFTDEARSIFEDTLVEMLGNPEFDIDISDIPKTTDAVLEVMKHRGYNLYQSAESSTIQIKDDPHGVMLIPTTNTNMSDPESFAQANRDVWNNILNADNSKGVATDLWQRLGQEGDFGPQATVLDMFITYGEQNGWMNNANKTILRDALTDPSTIFYLDFDGMDLTAADHVGSDIGGILTIFVKDTVNNQIITLLPAGPNGEKLRIDKRVIQGLTTDDMTRTYSHSTIRNQRTSINEAANRPFSKGL